MTEFFQTVAGRRYYERDVPQLIKQLTIIGEELRKMNDLNCLINKKEVIAVSNDYSVHPFTVEQLEKLAKVINDSKAFFLIDNIETRNYKAAQILDQLTKIDIKL